MFYLSFTFTSCFCPRSRFCPYKQDIFRCTLIKMNSIQCQNTKIVYFQNILYSHMVYIIVIWTKSYLKIYRTKLFVQICTNPVFQSKTYVAYLEENSVLNMQGWDPYIVGCYLIIRVQGENHHSTNHHFDIRTLKVLRLLYPLDWFEQIYCSVLKVADWWLVSFHSSAL